MARTFIEGSGQGQSDHQPEVLSVNDAGSVILPGNVNAGDLELARDGQDLVLTSPDGQVFVIEGYFLMPDAPVIIGANGALLSPSLVQSFVTSLGDIEVAAGPQVAVDLSPVGEVTEVSGNATVTHADGTKEKITAGTPIFEGDIVETDAAGAVNIQFADESTFAVSQNARLAVDDFSFNPDDQSGSTGLSILRGVFMFTSGLVGRENPDAVSLETPVGSIGIRGTIIGGEINANGKSQISVIEGAIVVRNGAGEQILSSQFETVQLTGFNAPISNIGTLNAGQMTQSYGAVRSVSPTLFTSIDDTARDSNESQGQQQPATDAQQNQQPQSDAPQTQTEAAPQANTLDQPVFQTLETGSNLDNSLGAAPSAPAPEAPAPAPINVAPPAPQGSAPAPANSAPASENLPPPSLVDTRPPASVVFSSNSLATIAANEDAPAGTSIGTVQQTQSLPFAVTYSLANNPGNIFAINPATGEITVAAGQHTGDVDATPGNHHDIVVRVTRTDTGVFTDTDLTINLDAVNEAPAFNTGLAAVNVDEGDYVTLTPALVGATDSEGDAITYTASHLLSGHIEVNGVTQNSFSHSELMGNLVKFVHEGAEPADGAGFKLTASDGSLSSAPQTFTVGVTNTNDAPTDMALSASNIAENSGNTTEVGTVTRTDSDAGDTAVYTMVNTAGGRFTISSSGVISVANGTLLDHEASTSHTVRVHVQDGSGGTYEKDFTINVGNVNEAPTNIALSSPSIAENTAASTIIGNLSATDPDSGGSHTYELLDTAGGRFGINGSGQIIVANASLLNFEAAPSHNIQVRVTDQGGLTFTKTLSISLTDVNETPTDITLSNDDVGENASNGTVVGIAAGVDADAGSSFAYALQDDAGGRFAIDSSTGEITVVNGSLLNFETADTHDIIVRVTDNGTPGLFYDKTFTINLNDVNDALDSVTTNLTLASVSEREAAGSPAVILGTVAVTDEDGNYDPVAHVPTVEFYDPLAASGAGAWVDGSARFEAVPNAGNNGWDLKLKAGAGLDYENETSIQLRVKITDGAYNETSNAVTLNILDADDTATEFGLNDGLNYNGGGQQFLISGRTVDPLIAVIKAEDEDLNPSFHLTAANYRISDVTGGFSTADFSVINLNGEQVLIMNRPSGHDFAVNSSAFTITVQMDANRDGDYNDAVDKSHMYSIVGRNDVMILEAVNGKNGYMIENDARFAGSSNGVRFGASLAAGDFNGDGRNDFVIGAPVAQNGESTPEETGGIYAFLNDDLLYTPANGTGEASDGLVKLSDMVDTSSVNGYFHELPNGNDGNRYGARMAVLKNFDGHTSTGADLAVVNPGAGTNFGSVEIRNGAGTVMTTVINVPNGGTTGDALADAITVTSLGDVNGDGLSDLLIASKHDNGGRGKAALIFGQENQPTEIDFAALTAAYQALTPEGASGAHFGAAAAGLGDINGDGYADFAVSAPDVDTNSGATGSGQGRVYVYFGNYNLDTVGSSINSNYFVLTGMPSLTNDHLGARISSAGDFNGDGFNDFMLRSETADSGRGSVKIVYGHSSLDGMATLDISQLNSAANFNGLTLRWNATDPSIKVGDIFTNAGDFNADGFDDVVVDVVKDLGASGFEHTLFVVYGFDGSGTVNLDALLAGSTSTDAAKAYKIKMLEPAGAHLSVTAAGDLNGDGFDDLLIGDPSATQGPDGSTTQDGEVYVVYGGGYNGGTDTGEVSYRHVTTSLQTNADSNTMLGNADNNEVIVKHARATFNAGDGDDTLKLSGVHTGGSTAANNAHAMIRDFDGGQGKDTLKLFFSFDGSSGENPLTPQTDIINLVGIGQKMTGVEMITFETGSYNDMLKLDIKDVMSLMSTAQDNRLVISASENIAGTNMSARNHMGIFLDGAQMTDGQLIAYGFSKDVDGINGVQDTTNLHGSQDAFVYTHVETGFELVLDSRLANGASLLG